MKLTQALTKARLEHPDRPAVVCGPRRASFAQLGTRVERVAGALRALGVQRGDRVGVLSLNTDRYLEICYGCWWLGAVLTPINFRWTADEIAFSLDDSTTTLLLVDEPFAAMVPALRERAKSLRAIAWLGEGALPADALPWSALVDAAAPVADVHAGGDDSAVLFYTGGTTGRAKGVLLSHASLYVTTLASIAIGKRASGVVCLHALPMFHVGGLAVVLQAMAGQSTQVMLPAFDPAAFLELIERERVVEAALVPTMIKRVVDHPALRERDISTLQRLYYGASPIDASLLEQTIAALPGVGLTQFYGMTETAGIAVALPDWCHSAHSRALGRHTAAGLPTLCTSMCVVDAEGRTLPVGDVGEVWLAGPGVMKGYWNQPEQTELAVRDGWMRTGDGGFIDADGLLHIVDRLKDMIVTGGENVYSTEVENTILSMPGIALCAVVGVPDGHWGEAVHAVLVLQPGALIDAAAVIAHCRSRMAGYKCPRSVEFRSELPISGAGKLLKFKLREAYCEGRAKRVA